MASTQEHAAVQGEIDAVQSELDALPTKDQYGYNRRASALAVRKLRSLKLKKKNLDYICQSRLDAIKACTRTPEDESGKWIETLSEDPEHWRN